MRPGAVIGAVLLLFVSAAGQAQSGEECDAAIEPSVRLVRMIYDPFERDLAPAFVTVTIRNASAGKCRLGLSLEGKGNRTQRFLTSGGTSLGYDISRDGRVLVNEVGNPQAQLAVQPDGSRDSRIELRFRVRGGEFVRAGDYTDQLILRLYQIGNGPPRPVGVETVLMVSALVPARAQLNVAGSQSRVFGANPAGSIDFGELRTGSERQAFIQVRATSPVILRLSSAEQGQLRHANFGTAVLGVPYSLTMAEEKVALEGGPAMLNRDPGESRGLENYRLRFRIDDAAKRVGGIYRDVLTISVEPR